MQSTHFYKHVFCIIVDHVNFSSSHRCPRLSWKWIPYNNNLPLLTKNGLTLYSLS